jgi:hypothetical protein
VCNYLNRICWKYCLQHAAACPLQARLPMCDCENEVLTPHPSTTPLLRPECCYEVYMVHAIMAWRMLESLTCGNSVHSPFRPERWYDWLRPSEFGHFAGQHLLFFFGAIESNQAANQVGFGFCSWMRMGWLEGWGRVHMHVTSDYFTQWRRGSGRNSEERTHRNHGQETKHHSTSAVDTTAAGGLQCCLQLQKHSGPPHK